MGLLSLLIYQLTLGFFMQYPYVHSNDPEPHTTKVKTNRIKFAPIATWISTLAETTTILLVCRDEQVPKRLQSHLVSGNWQYSLLKRDPARIFIDLLILLNEWAEVWTIARQDLAQKFLQVHTDELPLLRKTKELHRDAAEIIALREDLRLHVTAVRRFGVILGVQGPVMIKLGLLYGNKMGLGHDVIQEELEEQLEECLQNLLHQQESAAVIHKQLENLLSLVRFFSLEHTRNLESNISGVQYRDGLLRSGCCPPKIPCVHLPAIIICRG
jgi:hypothetical protein